MGRPVRRRLRLEQAQAAALRLGLIERDVGAFEKRLLIIPMARAKRAADAESDANARPSSMKCVSKREATSRRHQPRRLRGADLGGDDRQFAKNVAVAASRGSDTSSRAFSTEA